MARRPQHYGTLASIAAKLGVSRTTVSNAYNRPEQLSAELRQRILDTAEKMGYLGPDPMARSLRTRRAGSIGVLLTEHLSYAFEDMASVDFLAGMSEAAYGSDTMLTLVPASPDTSFDGVSAQELISKAVVDGFVVYSVAKDDPHLAAVKARGLPAVVCDQPADEVGLPFVGIDDYLAIAPAARVLMEAGHRRVGILSIRLDRVRNDARVSSQRLEGAQHHVQQSRIRGALDVFAAHGLEPGSVPVIECWLNDRAHNIAAAGALLESHPDLTAVLCTTDSLAFGVLEYASTHAISVPGELSVTGFDGTQLALAHQITTVIQPNRRKGFEAGNLLFGMIENNIADTPEPPATRVMLETGFNAGITVATPAT
ncbi:LacI family DNA-binding transcriptional regulator [Corynebacterium pacaense]|uniref:LacI family DNA-binding transcriptional regulator n=1 Tax=Corynebacterium pacaense TaxID=1816684 RepID=UPI0009BAAE06|nr:LacI family DNA-binding transcriptional regulator [Corynebacterium pacaense]